MPFRPGQAYELRRASGGIIGVLGALSVAAAALSITHSSSTAPCLALIACLALLINFHSIQITIDNTIIKVSYGIGLVAFEYDRHTVAGCEIITNYTFASLYNPRLEKMPQLIFRDGRRLTIPTADTRRLLEIAAPSR